MAVELATAYVSIIPSTDGIKGQLQKGMSGPIDKVGKESGSRLGGVMVGMAGKAMKAGGLAVAATFATSLVKGFGRLRAIDDARFKLEGLGHDAGTVDQIMSDALGSVKGTAFGLGDAATIAASAVASGIKPGKELEKTLSLTGDAASIAGTTLGEMGSIFGKVAAGNRLSMEEVNQLADRGVPIMQWLADSYGVSALEARKMVESGQVDFARFQSAIETNIGGAALTAGESFGGSFANMGAAVGRFGAVLLGPIFGSAPEVFGNITSVVDRLTERVGPLAERFGVWLPQAFETVQSVVGPIIATVSGWISGFGQSNSETGTWLAETWAKVRSTFQSAFDAVSAIVAFGTSAVRQMWDRFGTHILSFITTTWNNVKRVIDGALSIIKGIFDVFAGVFTGDWSRVWDGIKGIVSGVWNVIRGVVSQAINAVKTILGGVLATISLLWSGTWNTIKTALSAVWDGIKSTVSDSIDSVMESVRGLKDDVVGFFSGAKDWLVDAGKNIVQGLIDGIGSMVRALGDKISSVVSSITDRLPGSPVKKGPLKVLNRGQAGAQIVKMLAEGMGAEVGTLARMADAAARAAMPGGTVSGPRIRAARFGAYTPPDSSQADWLRQQMDRRTQQKIAHALENLTTVPLVTAFRRVELAAGI